MLVDISEIRAGGLATRHPLRGFDAVQLAAALTVCTAVGPRGIALRPSTAPSAGRRLTKG